MPSPDWTRYHADDGTEWYSNAYPDERTGRAIHFPHAPHWHARLYDGINSNAIGNYTNPTDAMAAVDAHVKATPRMTQFQRVYQAVLQAGRPVNLTEVIQLSRVGDPTAVLDALVANGDLVVVNDGGPRWMVPAR